MNFTTLMNKNKIQKTHNMGHHTNLVAKSSQVRWSLEYTETRREEKNEDMHMYKQRENEKRKGEQYEGQKKLLSGKANKEEQSCIY